MTSSIIKKIAAAAIVIAFAATLTGTQSHARDFFTSFFASLSGGNAPVNDGGSAPVNDRALPFAAEIGDATAQPAQPRVTQSASAYCVRTCDGRYFPISTSGHQSRAETCKSFCPASETKVVYGGGIDNARTDSGKSYSEMPNAFRYRNELVSGCTCNGKDSGGLAQIKIENDTTVRRGDLVANANGKLAAAPRTSASAANYAPRPRVARVLQFPLFAAQ